MRAAQKQTLVAEQPCGRGTVRLRGAGWPSQFVLRSSSGSNGTSFDALAWRCRIVTACLTAESSARARKLSFNPKTEVPVNRLIGLLLPVALASCSGPAKMSPQDLANEKVAVQVTVTKFWKAYEQKDLG